MLDICDVDACASLSYMNEKRESWTSEMNMEKNMVQTHLTNILTSPSKILF